MQLLSGRNCFRRVLLSFCLLVAVAQPVLADRLKDIASLQGVRNNQLIGYGIVVGLDGTGDQTTQTPFTTQAMGNMLAQMGINLTPDQTSKLQLKNVAAVMVTANLEPFARPGQNMDVTISSIGNAKSLRGGTLLMTQLKGADGQVYAVAQGNVMVGGIGATGGGGANVTVNHLSAGRIPAGATVERHVPTALGQGGFLYYELNEADFGTAMNAVEAINKTMGVGTAQAIDGRRIALRAPESADARVSFLGRVENVTIRTALSSAKVVVNPRTGSVVMNQRVALQPCAVAHGNLSVVVGAGEGGQGGDVQVNQGNGGMVNLEAGANLADVVKALNALGANPMDLLAILQAMKAAGALRAELEVI